MNDDLKNIIYAKALGSLDQAENEEFNRWIKNASDNELKEYAQLLNLSALLPMSLKIKEPPLELKNKIARELYRLRDELIAIKKPAEEQKETDTPEEKQETEESIQPPLVEEEQEEMEEEETIFLKEEPEEEFPEEQIPEPEKLVIPEKSETKLDSKFKKVETKNEAEEIKVEPPAFQPRLPQEEIRKDPPNNYVLPNYAEREEEIKRNYFGWILAVIGFVILASGLVYLYLSFTSSIDNLKQRVNDVNRRMDELAIEQAKPEPVKEILFVNDARIVNLENLSEDGIGYGNIVYSLEKGKGVIQLAAFPEPSGGSSFHLWLYSSREYSHLAEVLPDSTGDITEEFILPEVRNPFRSRFILTEDELGTFEFSNSEIYLEGSLR